MAIFEGAGVALVTPFKETGEINFDKLDELVEEQIAGGTDCIVAMGTTAESATTNGGGASAGDPVYLSEGERTHPCHCRYRVQLHKNCR